MGNQLSTKFNFYYDLKSCIKSKIEKAYPPNTFVEERNKTQYVSFNILGDIVKQSIQKNNLHLLFFKYLEPAGSPSLKVELMVSYERLKRTLNKELWFNEMNNKYLSEDKASVTEFINGRTIISRNRPVYKMGDLSDSEIEDLAKIALAVVEIQLGLPCSVLNS